MVGNRFSSTACIRMSGGIQVMSVGIYVLPCFLIEDRELRTSKQQSTFRMKF